MCVTEYLYRTTLHCQSHEFLFTNLCDVSVHAALWLGVNVHCMYVLSPWSQPPLHVATYTADSVRINKSMMHTYYAKSLPQSINECEPGPRLRTAKDTSPLEEQ